MAKSAKKIKPPKGTRDLYPEDVLRQRYITNAWRDASIRCGFDEIAGPTFESTDLYAVKSGDGILGELFQAFSGKSEREIEKVKATGQAEYALRPEFTPTLARMYAAKSKELPKPCKWFTAGPYFRAERPQRGRLREFLQWNVDVIGLPGEDATPESKAQVDAEIMECSVRLFDLLGLTSKIVTLKVSERNIITQALRHSEVAEAHIQAAFELLDARPKMSVPAFNEKVNQSNTNLSVQNFDNTLSVLKALFHRDLGDTMLKRTKTSGVPIRFLLEAGRENGPRSYNEEEFSQLAQRAHELSDGYTETTSRHKFEFYDFQFVLDYLEKSCGANWYEFDPSIVRGLAYYTGTVFEALADGERAVAGGGRYDNLIELFGGPPTPACGFGMGDVVLSNLLDDKELMPEGLELMEAVARPQASIRPEAFVVPNGDEDNESLVHTLTANLRRGIESESWIADENRKPWNADRYAVAPLHARISYKSTRKINKLRDDAMKQHAKFFIVIHAEDNAELHNLDTHETVGTFSTNPAADNYIGQAIRNAIAGGR